MMDFTQYGTLPHDYGFGAQKGSGSGSGGGTGTDPALTLSVIEDIERQQNVYTTKKWSAAWQTPAFTAARKTADAAYQAASQELVLVRVARDRVRRKVLVRVSELPPAVVKRFASLLPTTTTTGGGTTGGGTTGGGTGGGKGGGKGGGRGVGWEAALAAQAGAAPETPTNEQAAGQGAGTGTGEIIAGISNTTLLLLGGGAILAFVLVRRKGDKPAKVFKGT